MAAIKAPLHPSKESHFYDQVQGRLPRRGELFGTPLCAFLTLRCEFVSAWEQIKRYLHFEHTLKGPTKNMRTKTTTLKEKNNSANNIAWTCFLWERLLVPEAHPEYIFNNDGGAGAAGYEQRRVGCFDFTSVSDCSNRCCLFVGHLLKKHLSFSTKIMMETGLVDFFPLLFQLVVVIVVVVFLKLYTTL